MGKSLLPSDPGSCHRTGLHEPLEPPLHIGIPGGPRALSRRASRSFFLQGEPIKVVSVQGPGTRAPIKRLLRGRIYWRKGKTELADHLLSRLSSKGFCPALGGEAAQPELVDG